MLLRSVKPCASRVSFFSMDSMGAHHDSGLDISFNLTFGIPFRLDSAVVSSLYTGASLDFIPDSNNRTL
jgi:hypothetical protein